MSDESHTTLAPTASNTEEQGARKWGYSLHPPLPSYPYKRTTEYIRAGTSTSTVYSWGVLHDEVGKRKVPLYSDFVSAVPSSSSSVFFFVCASIAVSTTPASAPSPSFPSSSSSSEIAANSVWI